MSERTFDIVFAIYPGMTQLDFTGPYQFMLRLPGSEVVVGSAAGGHVPSSGLTFGDTRRLADIASCDLLCVPGGMASETAFETAFVDEIRRLGGGARYITSVCTGSLILGAAGLLEGRRATSHWAYRHLLPLFGAVVEEGRVVRDGNILTGGGVTAGIDMALVVLAEIGGVDVAQTIQLQMEYSPAPPFDAGRPETAPRNVLDTYNSQLAPILARHEREVRDAAAHYGFADASANAGSGAR